MIYCSFMWLWEMNVKIMTTDSCKQVLLKFFVLYQQLQVNLFINNQTKKLSCSCEKNQDISESLSTLCLMYILLTHGCKKNNNMPANLSKTSFYKKFKFKHRLIICLPICPKHRFIKSCWLWTASCYWISIWNQTAVTHRLVLRH